jgi:hypothetical protein
MPWPGYLVMLIEAGIFSNDHFWFIEAKCRLQERADMQISPHGEVVTIV